MAIAIYIKEKPKYYTLTPEEKRKKAGREKVFYGFISLVGLMAILFAAWPLLVWQIRTVPRLTRKIEKFPIPQNKVLSQNNLLQSDVQVVRDKDGFTYFSTNHTPQKLSISQNVTRPKEFYLTIPKLKIERALVKTDSLIFENNLAHFPNSAIPGEIGNAFITGHSILPQFYDPENYRTIFTKLSDLEVGDDVVIDVSGQKLHFIVQYSKIVDPHDTSVINPISNNTRNLTLMTCVPPGANNQRLVVITALL